MSDSFTLAVTGQSLIKHDTRNVRSPEFDRVKAIVKGADLAFTNFEGTIYGTHGGWPTKGFYFGSSKPDVLDALEEIGFKALSLSNNHSFDLGPSGILSTLDEVGKRGVLHAGIGRNKREALGPASTTFGKRAVAMVAMDGGPGLDFMYAADAAGNRPERPGVNRLRLSRIFEIDDGAFRQLEAILDKAGYSARDLYEPEDEPPLDPAELWMGLEVFRKSDRFKRTVKIDKEDLKNNLQAIRAAANAGNLVISYLHHHHWESDWQQSPDWISAFARQCIDAGAAVFISHGVPMLLPIEIYRGRPIFHSLGNFIFHVSSEITWKRNEVWESVVGLCSFDQNHRLTSLTLHPLVIGGEEGLEDEVLERRLVPHLATGAAADRILRRVASASMEYDSHIEVIEGVGKFALA
ncbi:CapA family protein [Mesorhizobium sp.]|uniref:CapA family protein n=1 Tax=Mesorhizobium sp. TaxID=1871066 RepID=UPI000FE56A6B|nr:CapA family protein [Mesorhizobium sp.]RWM77802.1 MAG: capsule biosynthesis protein CapA [Mesorhizobium sp.]TIL70402.1 MAG: CapA family protein [Mesorhizobium sp.]